MLGRGRFIPGKAAASRRKSKDCPDDESRAEGVIHGTATLLSGLGGGLSLDGKSLDPTAPQTASRNPPEKTKNSANVVTTNKKQHSMLSPNAALLLCPAGLQADEIEVDGADDVSSMNDSIYFGGGASVTGGYARRRNPSRPSPPHVQSLKRSGDRVAPGASPEVPTNLLGVHDSDVHSVDSGNGNPPSPLADVEQAMGNVQPTTPRRNADFALVDIDYAMANKHENQRDGANAAISPTSAIISAASNDKSPNNKSSRCCCCCETPGWIQRAPYWLKAVLVGSIVLLLAAIALVAVGLLMAYDKGGNSSLSSSSSQAQGSATSVVTLAPTTSTSSKMTAPTVKQNSTAQTPPGPGKDDLTKLMVIYLTAGQYSDNLKQQAGTGLSTFPTREGTSFMVHMGDWNDPSMNCDGKSYQAESDLFHPSSIPVYFVMGANGKQSSWLW